VLARGSFVFAGEASYCLYMTHVLLMPGLHWLVSPADVQGRHVFVRLAVLVLYATVLAAVAVLLYRLVEVPARHRLRSKAPAVTSPRSPVAFYDPGQAGAPCRQSFFAPSRPLPGASEAALRE
jgi:peptidoglycan/LPS O-acetylase OafA/YrhL